MPSVGKDASGEVQSPQGADLWSDSSLRGLGFQCWGYFTTVTLISMANRYIYRLPSWEWGREAGELK